MFLKHFSQVYMLQNLRLLLHLFVQAEERQGSVEERMRQLESQVDEKSTELVGVRWTSNC